MSIDDNKVNDDYCDCKNGNDEFLTGACSNFVFKCLNKNVDGEFVTISSSKVNDGICDCCDCTDEPNPTTINFQSCDTINELNKKNIQNELKILIQANNSIKELKDINIMKKALENTISIIKKKMIKYKNDIQQIYKQYQKKSSRKLEVDYEKKTSLYTLSSQEYVSLNTYINNNNFQYINLTTTCYKSRDINELEMKGGSVNYIYKNYKFYYFHKNPKTWEMKNNFVKMGGSIEDAERTILNQKNDAADVTNLGFYTDTKEMKSFFTGKNEWIDIYISNTKCINGESRYVYVTNQEDGMCIYYMLFQTPLACDFSKVDLFNKLLN
ncbi:hypothetical protein WA158_006649 [Blastocystis sp. Blastoise]